MNQCQRSTTHPACLQRKAGMQSGQELEGGGSQQPAWVHGCGLVGVAVWEGGQPGRDVGRCCLAALIERGRRPRLLAQREGGDVVLKGHLLQRRLTWEGQRWRHSKQADNPQS